MEEHPREEARGSGWVEIGREMARAVEADERHRIVHGDVPSPLHGTAYDPTSGELDLHRFVESPTDERLRKFVEGYAALSEDRRQEVRVELTMDDFYTLLAFARRCALATLRSGNATTARSGLMALTAIDAERVDWRDVSVAAALLSYVLGDQAATLFLTATAQSESAVAEILRGFGEEPVESLEDSGYREVEIVGSRAFFHDEGERYEPSADLIELAIRIATVIERDAYRVTNIGVGHDLPEVWLRGGDQQAVSRALESLAGCVVVQAELHPDAHPNAHDQQFTVFIAEAESHADASLLAGASTVSGDAGHQALGLAAGHLCSVVIARSFVEGVPGFESAGALERFRPALSKLIAGAASS